MESLPEMRWRKRAEKLEEEIKALRYNYRKIENKIEILTNKNNAEWILRLPMELIHLINELKNILHELKSGDC